MLDLGVLQALRKAEHPSRRNQTLPRCTKSGQKSTFGPKTQQFYAHQVSAVAANDVFWPEKVVRKPGRFGELNQLLDVSIAPASPETQDGPSGIQLCQKMSLFFPSSLIGFLEPYWSSTEPCWAAGSLQ